MELKELSQRSKLLKFSGLCIKGYVGEMLQYRLYLDDSLESAVGGCDCIKIRYNRGSGYIDIFYKLEGVPLQFKEQGYYHILKNVMCSFKDVDVLFFIKGLVYKRV